MNELLRDNIAKFIEKQVNGKKKSIYLPRNEVFQDYYDYEDFLAMADVIIPMVKGTNKKFVKPMSDKKKMKIEMKKRYTDFIMKYHNMLNNNEISQQTKLIEFMRFIDDNVENGDFILLNYLYHKLHKTMLDTPNYYPDIILVNFIMCGYLYSTKISNYEIFLEDLYIVLKDNYGYSLEETGKLLNGFKR